MEQEPLPMWPSTAAGMRPCSPQTLSAAGRGLASTAATAISVAVLPLSRFIFACRETKSRTEEPVSRGVPAVGGKAEISLGRLQETARNNSVVVVACVNSGWRRTGGL
jgi:hypothetical protein